MIITKKVKKLKSGASTPASSSKQQQQYSPSPSVDSGSSTSPVPDSLSNFQLLTMEDIFWESYSIEEPPHQTYSPSPRPENLRLRDRGLTNKFGENNCFLNVVIQSLYHLTPFRTRFMSLQEHNHVATGSKCIFCSLRVVLLQYHYGTRSSISPIGIREALSVVYSFEHKFQLGKTADAAEAHEALLNCLHNSLNTRNHASNQETECNPSCLVHKIFSINQMEVINCTTCNQVVNVPFSEMIHYVPAQQLISSRAFRVTHDGSVQQCRSLGELISRSRGEELRHCQYCEGTVTAQYQILNIPEVMTIGIIWNTSAASSNDIVEILTLVDKKLTTAGIFATYVENSLYRLRGMICYYGFHYVSFFLNPITKEWIAFDDKNVKKLGKKWRNVINRCSVGRLQPLLLWYEKDKYFHRQ